MMGEPPQAGFAGSSSGSRRRALTSKPGREEADLEAHPEPDSFLLPLSGGVGALHLMHWDLVGGEGHLCDNVHHGPRAAE